MHILFDAPHREFRTRHPGDNVPHICDPVWEGECIIDDGDSSSFEMFVLRNMFIIASATGDFRKFLESDRVTPVYPMEDRQWPDAEYCAA